MLRSAEEAPALCDTGLKRHELLWCCVAHLRQVLWGALKTSAVGRASDKCCGAH